MGKDGCKVSCNVVCKTTHLLHRIETGKECLDKSRNVCKYAITYKNIEQFSGCFDVLSSCQAASAMNLCQTGKEKNVNPSFNNEYWARLEGISNPQG